MELSLNDWKKKEWNVTKKLPNSFSHQKQSSNVSAGQSLCWEFFLKLTSPMLHGVMKAWSSGIHISICYRTKSEALLHNSIAQKVKHTKNQVMVWGIINSRGVGPLKFIDGYLNAEGCCEIVKNVVAPQMKKW